MTFPFLETLIFSFFDVLQYYLLTNKLSNGKIQVNPWHAIGLLGGAVLGTIISVSVSGIYAIFANVLVLLGLCYFLYKRTGLQLVYLSIIGMVLTQTVQLLIIILIYASNGKIEYTSNTGMAAQVMGLVLAYVTARYIPIHLLFRYVESKNNLFRVVIINVFILMTFCAIYWYLHFEGVIENIISIAVIVIIVLLINLIFLREGLKNQAVEEQYQAYQRYMPIVNELIDEIRIKQHDFNNHITALKIVMDQKTVAESVVKKVEDYLHEAEASFRNADLLNIKNRIVSGFLYSKKKQAKEAGIQLEIYIEDYVLETSLTDYELMDILSVLVDNAFETGIQGNLVKIHFLKEKEKSVIEVANKHPYIPIGKINEFFIKGFSSKGSDKRGLGLYKLKALISKCQGRLEVSNVDDGENYVVFRVTLPDEA